MNADVVVILGRMTEAEVETQRAEELDPDGVSYSTGECMSKRVSLSNEARTACYVLY